MTTEASGAGAPKCKLCQKNHWLRDGCDGRLQERVAKTNTPQGRARRSEGLQPTSSASTESPDPTYTSTVEVKRPKQGGEAMPDAGQHTSRLTAQGGERPPPVPTPAKRKRAKKKRKAKRGGKTK